MGKSKSVYVTVRLDVASSADEFDVVQECDYSFDHEDIQEFALVDVETAKEWENSKPSSRATKEEPMTDETQSDNQSKTIELSHFAVITLNGDGTGSIDGALIDERPDGWESDPFHVTVDNLFGMALLHALAGIDVGGRAYERGFEQQLAALVEEYGDD